eukprot:UN03531
MFNYHCTEADSGNNTFNNSQISNVNNYYVLPQTLPIPQPCISYNPYNPYTQISPLPPIQHIPPIPWPLIPHAQSPHIPQTSLIGRKRKYNEVMNSKENDEQQNANKKQKKSTMKRRKPLRLDDVKHLMVVKQNGHIQCIGHHPTSYKKKDNPEYLTRDEFLSHCKVYHNVYDMNQMTTRNSARLNKSYGGDYIVITKMKNGKETKVS